MQGAFSPIITENLAGLRRSSHAHHYCQRWAPELAPFHKRIMDRHVANLREFANLLMQPTAINARL